MAFKRVSLPITFYLILFFNHHFIFFDIFIFCVTANVSVSCVCHNPLLYTVHHRTAEASCSQFWHPGIKGHRLIFPLQVLGKSCAFFPRFNGCQKLCPFPAVGHLLHKTSSLCSTAVTLFAVIVTSKGV